MKTTSSIVNLNLFSSSEVKILAGIPCHNTESSIANLIDLTKPYVSGIIVVDDGSTDTTAEKASSKGTMVISHPKNKGYGEAIKSCFSAAQAINADVLVTIDGDGQHNPSDIPRVLKPILNKEADIVIGSRFLDINNGIPKYRKIGLNLINFLWNINSRIKVTDTQSGYRAYNVHALKDLTISNKGMSASIEILEQARHKQMRIKEVSINCSYENNNSSLSLKSMRHGINVAFFTIMVRLQSHDVLSK
jgi:glycosyltransferase involved in cell wall biosynthesis